MAQENPQAQDRSSGWYRDIRTDRIRGAPEQGIQAEDRPGQKRGPGGCQDARPAGAWGRFFNLRRRSSHHPISRWRTGS